MRSPFRIFRRPESRRPESRRPDRLALAAVAALVIAGCGSSDSELAGSDELVGVVGVVDAPDRVLTGPQGARGQFVVECGFDRFLPDDPIVHPGKAGASHLHQFFGAVDVSVESTYDTMLEGGTTCDQLADTASYWSPTLVGADGEPIEPVRAVAYYRAGPDVEPTDVVPYPPGLMMVAGDHTAYEPQPLSAVAWSCESGGRREVRPFDCGGAPSLRMWVTFQDCWNGIDERSPIVPQPSMHVAYSTAGACPESHPVHIPQLQLAIDFPVPPADQLDELALSSGNILSGHADFWNAWHQDKLRNEVVNCIHRDLPCGVSG